jgi:hypothetical protein
VSSGEGRDSERLINEPRCTGFPTYFRDAYPHWDAAEDFRGPPAPWLSSFEQLALVLLQTDELVFLD